MRGHINFPKEDFGVSSDKKRKSKGLEMAVATKKIRSDFKEENDSKETIKEKSES